MKKHVAIYGSLKLMRGYCSNCKDYALIIDNVLQCCDTEIDNNELEKRTKRMTQTEGVRRRPSKKAVNKMLEIQDNKCFYCDIPFGTSYKHPRLDKYMETKVCYDHLVPFAYSQDNQDINFVCACGTCNGIKSDLIFQTVEEARDYVKYRRKKKGYTDEIYIL